MRQSGLLVLFPELSSVFDPESPLSEHEKTSKQKTINFNFFII